VTSVNSQAISVCAAGLLVSFFLPWTEFLGKSISGFDLQKLGGQQKLLWLIPIFSAITIVAGPIGKSQRIAAQVAGGLPFLVLIYWYQKLGENVFHILSGGAYASLFFGLVITILSVRKK
jgi:hypothetical protein